MKVCNFTIMRGWKYCNNLSTAQRYVFKLYRIISRTLVSSEKLTALVLSMKSCSLAPTQIYQDLTLALRTFWAPFDFGLILRLEGNLSICLKKLKKLLWDFESLDSCGLQVSFLCLKFGKNGSILSAKMSANLCLRPGILECTYTRAPTKLVRTLSAVQLNGAH